MRRTNGEQGRGLSEGPALTNTPKVVPLFFLLKVKDV